MHIAFLCHLVLSLANLEKLKGSSKQIRIIQQCATSYPKIGHYLLNDTSGSIVNNLRLKHSNDPEKILEDILSQWMCKDANHSWEKLIECLRRCELNSIASDIEECLGMKIQPAKGMGCMVIILPVM